MKLIALVLVVACSGKSEDKSPQPKAAEGQPAAVVGSGSGAPATARASTPALSPKIKAARCGEPCLFLTDTPLAKLADTYKAECGGMVTKDLGFDDCKHLDFTRNCIYAAHGLVFKNKRWKQFATKPWYDANADFKAAAISELERANVHELDQRGKACKKGLHISGADYERIKQWFAALPKAPMPKVILTGDDGMDALQKLTSAELVELLRDDLKLELPSGAAASYDREVPAAMVKAIAAGADVKLRSILIDVDSGTVGDEDNPITEGTYVRFVYDDKDQLRAVSAYHYLYD